MRMWDLVKGRCTYHVRLEVEAEGVEFCREDGGARYALLCGARLTVHGVQGDAGAWAGALRWRAARALCARAWLEAWLRARPWDDGLERDVA